VGAAHFFVSSPLAPGNIAALALGQEANRWKERPVILLQLHPVAQKVVELLEPHIERQGFELVMVEFRKGTRHSLLRLLVDKPGGGVALSDLERLSPVLGDLLDVYDPVDGSYTLEVASPGINRPLAKLKDFEAYRGQRVKITTHRPRDGRKHFEGILESVNAKGIELDDVLSRKREVFDFDEIREANYEHNFNN
jgi:ribosome maturation factor RimP